MCSPLRLSAIALSVLMIAGCSDPKIDTSSMPASVVSVEKVRNSLPTYKRDDFDQGLIIISTASTFNSIDILNPNRMNAAEIAESANVQMHGLTGDQVIQRADQILRERRSREREQAIRTLTRLEEKQAKAKSDQQQLARFSIDNARYYMGKSPYGAPEPVIDLEVTNNTDKVVSELSLRGIVTSPDRSQPWVDEQFYYVVPGGIEPGETLAWSLAPNRFGPWGEPQIPSNAELTVRLEGLRGADEQPLWDSPALSKSEITKLERLRAEYGGVALSNVE
ncbi:Lipoprotein [Halomonas sp. NYA30]